MRDQLTTCGEQFLQLSPEQQQQCAKAQRLYLQKQLPHLTVVVKRLQSAILEITESPDGTASCVIDMSKVRSQFSEASWRDGVLAFNYEGHHYENQILLLAPECVRVSVQQERLTISIAARPDKKKREFVAECGKYAWQMIEDDKNWWVWDLMPAFAGPEVVFRGGPLTNAEIAKIRRETTEKSKCSL